MLRARRVPGQCPNCGMKEEQAVDSGLVGCPLCYEMLSEASLAHFGIHRAFRPDEKPWNLSVPETGF